MPKKIKRTDWNAKARMALIRKQNVERHVGYEARQKLRQNIIRHQTNATLTMEHDRLLHAQVQGNLHAAAERRLGALKNMIVK
jgi:hypothetical protein